MTTRALARGLQVLEAIAEAGDGGLGPSAVARALRLDKATVLRLLVTLSDLDYIVQDPVTRGYRLTAKVVRLARKVTDRLDLREVARPHLEALRSRVRETVHLATVDGVNVVYIDKLESEQSIQFKSMVGQVMPLHSTALGKAFLAALPEDQRESRYGRLELTPRTERTLTTLDGLRADVDQTRVRGYAIDDRENEPSGACVAAAICGPDGSPIAAVSVTGPDFRMRDRFRDLGDQVRATAALIAWDLGAARSRDPIRPEDP